MEQNLIITSNFGSLEVVDRATLEVVAVMADYTAIQWELAFGQLEVVDITDWQPVCN